MPAADNTSLMFGLMVSIAILLLLQGLVVSSVDKSTTKRLQRRLHAITAAQKDEVTASLLREKYLKKHSRLDLLLHRVPGIPALYRIIEQSDHSGLTVSRLLLFCLLLMAVGAAVVWLLFGRNPVSAGVVGLLAACLPLLKLRHEGHRRLEQFEEQLPDALDTMVRSLRTGYPFIETLRVVGEELEEPISKEFGATFADINYGMDIRIAFLNLLERLPSLNLLSVVTAVLVKRETGGNMTEVLEKISVLVRGRFKFQRRIRTLSAEARLSAWVLAMLPFVTAAVVQVTSPDYLAQLTEDPAGIKIIGVSFGMMVAGIFWLKRLLAKVMNI